MIIDLLLKLFELLKKLVKVLANGVILCINLIGGFYNLIYCLVKRKNKRKKAHMFQARKYLKVNG